MFWIQTSAYKDSLWALTVGSGNTKERGKRVKLQLFNSSCVTDDIIQQSVWICLSAVNIIIFWMSKHTQMRLNVDKNPCPSIPSQHQHQHWNDRSGGRLRIYQALEAVAQLKVCSIHFWKQNSDKWSELNLSLTTRRHLEADKGMVPIWKNFSFLRLRNLFLSC